MGHTASLIVVGIVVLLLRVAIPESISSWLEFGVAIMIIVLGVNAFARSILGREDVHVHRHRLNGVSHVHLHFPEPAERHSEDVPSHSHRVSRVGLKPVFVGAMLGLAGSGALTLLVLSQIESPALGLLYLLVFGLGSVVGMLLMSFLVGLPFDLSANWLSGLSYNLQSPGGFPQHCLRTVVCISNRDSERSD
jgi:cytochrome c biogenesis protein CcdA